jgi:hypothetical protein
MKKTLRNIIYSDRGNTEGTVAVDQSHVWHLFRILFHGVLNNAQSINENVLKPGGPITAINWTKSVSI